MRFIQQLSLLASVASVVVAQATTPAPSATASCPAYSCVGGAQGGVASTLSGYAPASSLCSASYVSRQTCTLRGSTSTVFTTVSTVTTTSTVASTTVTVTGTTRTITATTTTTPRTTITTTNTRTNSATQTSIITVSETITQNANQKRQNGAAPTVSNTDLKSRILSSLKASQSSAYIAAVCTCLVRPASATVLVQPVTTSRVTATSTARVAFQARTTVTPSTTVTRTITAAQVTSTVTASATTVTTSVTLTSVTETATATAVNRNACTPAGPGLLFPGQCGTVDSEDDQCACYIDTAGRGFCANYYGECGPPCEENSDCAPGLNCLAETESDCDSKTCALPTDGDECSTSASGQKRKKRSFNPMAFKMIARAAKQRHVDVYVAPTDADQK